MYIENIKMFDEMEIMKKDNISNAESVKNYKERNKEKIKKASKEYYKRNKEKIIKRVKKNQQQKKLTFYI